MSEEQERKTCGTCKHWHKLPSVNPDGTIRAGPAHGACRGGPPQLYLQPVQGGGFLTAAKYPDLPETFDACGVYEAAAGQELVWQLHDHNEWRIGRSVRGAVRAPYLAEVYYNEEKGWVWLAILPETSPYPGPTRGIADRFDRAIFEAEEVLRKAGLLAR